MEIPLGKCTNTQKQMQKKKKSKYSNGDRIAKRNTKAREDVGIPPGSDSTARSPPPSVTITSHSMPTK